MPKRVQRSRKAGWRKPANTVYVGRGSQWGNPHVVGVDGTAQECIEKYAKDWCDYTHKEGTLDKLLITTANLDHIISELRGKNLMCWCRLDQPCHADWLLQIANDDHLRQALEENNRIVTVDYEPKS